MARWGIAGAPEGVTLSSTTGQFGPPNEAERLAAIRRYDILDTPPDRAFDRVTRLAARLLGVPISTISIVDHDRIWFKSRHGLDTEQIDHAPGLCASAILQEGPWVVADAEVDPRTLDNPLVRGELGLRFYAGVPLRTSDGYNLGTLNVIDTKPREVTEDELATLGDLAAIVVHELDLRLAARDEAERLTRARIDFIAIAAHELRTPLAAVYGAAKLLAEPDHGEAESRRKLLAMIAEESEHLATVIGGILTGAQLESGEIAFVNERFDPLPVLESVVEAARVNLPENLSLELLVGSDLPELESDPGKVRQILGGLLDNAVKYSPDGGRITVRAQPRAGGIRLQVDDQGIGIPPSESERVFERFVRLDGAQEHTVGGTGLGLYIARELARRLGATVECVPRRGGAGSSFVLKLPARSR
jgi:signal transduction histidine kinase